MISKTSSTPPLRVQCPQVSLHFVFAKANKTAKTTTPPANSSTSAVDASPYTAIWESSGNRCSSGISTAKNQAQIRFWLRTSSLNWFHSFVLFLVLVLDNFFVDTWVVSILVFYNRTLTYQREICDLLSSVI